MFNIVSNGLGFITNLRGPQLIIIVLVVLLLFGSKRLPDMARGFGKALREFRKAASDAEDGFKKSMKAEEAEAKKEVASTTEKPNEDDTRKSA